MRNEPHRERVRVASGHAVRAHPQRRRHGRVEQYDGKAARDVDFLFVLFCVVLMLPVISLVFDCVVHWFVWLLLRVGGAM